MRLFCVMNTETNNPIVGQDGRPHYFPDKQSAKKVRDELNELNTQRIFTVNVGPDHRRSANVRGC